jgi:hypothetical protein
MGLLMLVAPWSVALAGNVPFARPALSTTNGEILVDKLVEGGGDGLWGPRGTRRETFAPSMPVRREET